MIRIGPAGIPLSCKGRTLKDGIIYTKSLELDALEVQFVRGIRMTEEDAAEVGEVAEAADVELHVHAPYYTNLAGDARNLELTRDKVLKAANLAHIMGAHSVVVHPGFYGELTPEEATERVAQVCGDLRDEFRANKWTPKLALETMGKRSVFGSLEEVIQVCQQVEDVLPVIDFAHIHARGNGSLNTVEDFQDVFDKLIPLGLDHYLIHFTGVMYENGNERHHLPIKKGDLRFEPLVEVILENDYNVTLISTSPILEHDAMYMQIVLDRVKEKREQRMQRDLQKAEEDRIKAQEEEAKAREEEARRAAEEAERARKEAEAKKAEPPEPRPQCAAFTQSGDPCRNPARTGSKYCSSHKGYRPNKAPKKAPAKKATKKTPAKKATKKTPSKSAKGSGSRAAKKTASTRKSPTKGSRKEVTPKKRSAKKTATKKPAAKKTAAKKTAAKKTPAKKTATKKAAAKKTPAKKTATKKAAKKAPAKKAATKKAAKKSAATKPAAPSPAKDAEKGGMKGRLKAAAGRLVGRKKK